MNINDLEQQHFFGGERVVLCPRCGKPGRVAGGGDTQARIARYADQAAIARNTHSCLECAITGWLKDLEMVDAAELHGLLLPHVQKQFAALVNASMHEDFRPEEIDWQRIVDNWELPMPKPKQKKRR